jgi:hypothetical protein
VITDAGPFLFGAMDFVDALDCHRHTLGGGGTMDYDFVYSSHA